jgi:hypothetical protein
MYAISITSQTAARCILLMKGHLAPHGVKVGATSLGADGGRVVHGLDVLHVELESKVVQEVGHSARVPSSAASLEPAEVATERRRHQHRVGITLELFVGDGFLDRNGVVCGVQSQEGNPDGQDGVRGRGISVVRRLGRVSPCRALDRTIKLVEVRRLLDRLKIEVRELLELDLVRANKFLERTSHDTEVDLPANVAVLQHLVGDLEVVGAGACNRGLELAMGALFADILPLLDGFSTKLD